MLEYDSSMINENFIFLAAFINILGGISYLIDVLKGKAIPNRVTWLLWALAPGLAFAAQVKQGVGLTAVFTFTTFFLPLLVFIASYVNKQSVWKLSKVDYVCGALSLIGLMVWLITGEGNIAIIAAILADGFAAIPTLIKSYHEPHTENWIGYAAGAIGAFITLLTIETFTFENTAFAGYIFLMTTTLVFLIGIRPLQKHKH